MARKKGTLSSEVPPEEEEAQSVGRREFIERGTLSMAVMSLLSGGMSVGVAGCSSTRRERTGGGGGEMCTDSCTYSADGDCDDGGEGAVYSLCEHGTDCTDCGPRGGSYADSAYADSAYADAKYSDYSDSAYSDSAYSDYSDYSDYRNYSNSYSDYYSNYYNYFVNSF